MTPEQKQRAMQMLRRFSQATPMTRTADNAAVAMAALLQELVDAPEPEPFGYFKAEPFGWTDCAETDDGAIALFAAPPAPSVPDGWKHDCAGIMQNDVELWLDSCPHCGKPKTDAAPTPAEAPADGARDAERLDWLDERNAPHGLGWEIIQMPAGNVHIHTLTGDKAKFESIRDAIDAAIERQGGES